MRAWQEYEWRILPTGQNPFNLRHVGDNQSPRNHRVVRRTLPGDDHEFGLRDRIGLLRLDRLVPVVRHDPRESRQLRLEVDQPVRRICFDQVRPPVTDVLENDCSVDLVGVEDIDLREVVVEEEPEWLPSRLGLCRPEPPFKPGGVLNVLRGKARV